jgi:hypothetical protein
MRDGSYVRADELEPGTSCMALYRNTSNRRAGDFATGYERVYDHHSASWIYTHRLVANECPLERDASLLNERSSVIHHTSYDKRNNNPDQLLLMGKKAHIKHHQEHANVLKEDWCRDRLRDVMKSEKYAKKHRSSVIDAWQKDDGTRRRLVAKTNRAFNKIEKMQRVLSEMREMGLYDTSGSNSPTWKPRPSYESIVKCVLEDKLYIRSQIAKRLGCSETGINDTLEKEGTDWNTFIAAHTGTRKGRKTVDSTIDYHKIVTIAASSSNRSEFHTKNFMSRCGFENYLRRQGKNPIEWYDSHIGVKNHKVLSVNVIVLEEPVPVYDLEIEKWSNFSLSVGVVVHNSKATLAQEDIRFSRSIQRIQKTVLAELNKAPEGLVSRRWIRKNILELTDQEIESLKEEREDDKLEDAAVESAGTEEAPEGGEAGGEAGGAEGGEEGGEGGGLGDLFAGDQPQGDLLVAASPRGKGDDEDEEDEEEEFKLPSIDDPDAPIKISNRIERTSARMNMFGEPLKKSRKQTRGPASTGLHDFASMTGLGNTQSTLRDPYQKNWLKKPLGVGEAARGEAEADRVISSMQRSTKFARPKILREAGSQNSREEDLELDVDLDFLGSEFDK